MDLDMHKSGDVQVIRLRGSLRLGEGVDQFRRVVENLAAQGDVKVVVNLSEVPMVDSTGIGALVRAQTSMKPKGGAVRLVAPGRLVLQTLTITGLLTVFEVYDDDAKAIAAFS